MSYLSPYDDILEDMPCPECGHVGMVSSGGLDYECPNCGYEGTLEKSCENDTNEDDN